MPELTGHHYDLPAVVAFVGRQVGSEMHDVWRETRDFPSTSEPESKSA